MGETWLSWFSKFIQLWCKIIKLKSPHGIVWVKNSSVRFKMAKLSCGLANLDPSHEMLGYRMIKLGSKLAKLWSKVAKKRSNI